MLVNRPHPRLDNTVPEPCYHQIFGLLGRRGSDRTARGTGRQLRQNRSTRITYRRPPPCHLEAEGRCASVTRVSGSSRVARRPVSVGAVAALSCCTFSGSSSQRPIVGKMRLCRRDRSSAVRSAAVAGAGRRSGAVRRGRSCPWRCRGWVLYGSPPRPPRPVRVEPADQPARQIGPDRIFQVTPAVPGLAQSRWLPARPRRSGGSARRVIWRMTDLGGRQTLRSSKAHA